MSNTSVVQSPSLNVDVVDEIKNIIKADVNLPVIAKFNSDLVLNAEVSIKELMVHNRESDLWVVPSSETFKKLCHNNNLSISFQGNLQDDEVEKIFQILKKSKGYVTISQKPPQDKPVFKVKSEKSDHPKKPIVSKEVPEKKPFHSQKEKTEKSVNSHKTNEKVHFVPPKHIK